MQKPCLNCDNESSVNVVSSNSSNDNTTTISLQKYPVNQLPKSNVTLDFSDNKELESFISNLEIPYLATVIISRKFLHSRGKEFMNFRIPWVNIVDVLLKGNKSNSPFFNQATLDNLEGLYCKDEKWKVLAVPIILSIIKEYCNEMTDIKAQLYLNYLIEITEDSKAKGLPRPALLPFRKLVDDWYASGAKDTSENRRRFKLTLLPILEAHPYDAENHTMPLKVPIIEIAQSEFFISLGIDQHIPGINLIIPEYITNFYELHHMLYYIQEKGLVKNSLTPEIVQNSLPTIVNDVRYENAKDFLAKSFASYIKENNIKGGKVSVLDPALLLPSNYLDGFEYPKLQRDKARMCYDNVSEPGTE
tara:strand:+ start:3546 stop:4628 length:1083 start_codon:yes stop_codon:yes gene_type:complete